MINQYEFAEFLQGVLDDSTIAVDALFKVRTPDIPFVDSIANKITTTDDLQTHILPVMVEQTQEGGYDATPEIGMWDGSLSVTFLFPLSELRTIELYYDYIAQELNGKIKKIGDISGKCVMAIGQRTLGQMQLLDVGQFSQINQQVMALYGRQCVITREWMTMNFVIDFSGAKNLGKENGIIYGNSISRILTIKSDKGVKEYEENLVLVDASSANSIMAHSQQYIGGGDTKSVPTCSAKGVTFTAYVRDNDFWDALINFSRADVLSSHQFMYEESFLNRNNTLVNLFIGGVIITDIGFAGGYGEPLTCSMSLLPKAEVADL